MLPVFFPSPQEMMFTESISEVENAAWSEETFEAPGSAQIMGVGQTGWRLLCEAQLRPPQDGRVSAYCHLPKVRLLNRLAPT